MFILSIFADEVVAVTARGILCSREVLDYIAPLSNGIELVGDIIGNVQEAYLSDDPQTKTILNLRVKPGMPDLCA